MSQAVSDTVQNNGGNSHQPICRHVGQMISMGSVSLMHGKIKQKCHESSSDTTRCQNPSFISHLAKITGPCSLFVPAIIDTNHHNTFPICSIALWSESSTVSALKTQLLSVISPSVLNANMEDPHGCKCIKFKGGEKPYMCSSLTRVHSESFFCL